MSGEQRAIVLANRLPYPLNDGWKVRTFHVIRQIARRMPVTLVVFHDPGDEATQTALGEALDGQVELVPVRPPHHYSPLRLALGVVSRWPIQYWNNRAQRFQESVDRVIREQRPTVAVAVCTFMVQYLEDHDALPLRIVDTHNIDSELMRLYVPHTRSIPRRAYARLTVEKLRALEDHALSRVEQIWVCSEDEADLLARRKLKTPVHVIANGVDTNHFAGSGHQASPGRLLFFGKLNYFPNVDALFYLVQKILPRLGEVTFQVAVVGTGATRAVEELCASAPLVELVGPVEDVREWLFSAELVVVPLRMGSGTRLKILEAMAAGRPVLSTSIGAEGIIAVPGRDILKADTADDFAHQIARVLADRTLGERIGRSGQHTVRRFYDWNVIGDRIGNFLNDA